MFLSASVAVAFAFLPLRVLSQTPPGFSPNVETSLDAVFTSSNTTVSPPGILIPRADTASPPELFAPVAGANETYIAFMMDLDITLETNAPNAPRYTYLHYFQPNLVSSSPANVLISNNETDIKGASYILPSPPFGNGPHRYVLLLFTQPSDFEVPSAYADINPPANLTVRIGFNITTFMAAAGLADPVAATYFLVLNGTAAETASVTMSVALATGPVTTTAATLTETSAIATSVASGSGIVAASASASAGVSAGAGLTARNGVKELFVAGGMAVVGAAVWML